MGSALGEEEKRMGTEGLTFKHQTCTNSVLSALNALFPSILVSVDNVTLLLKMKKLINNNIRVETFI